MKKRWIIAAVVIVLGILSILAVPATFVYFNSAESYGGGGSRLDKNNSITFGCNLNERNVFLKLEVNVSNIKGIVRYYVKNPKGEILDQGVMDESNSSFAIDKKYPGVNGTWKIEFEDLSADEKVSYTIDEEATNLNNRSAHR